MSVVDKKSSLNNGKIDSRWTLKTTFLMASKTMEYIVQFVLEVLQFWRCYNLHREAIVRCNVNVDDPFLG